MDHRTGAHAVVPGALWRGHERAHEGMAEQSGVAAGPGRRRLLRTPVEVHHERVSGRVRVRAGARCADPLFAAHPGLLSGARLWRALSVGALCRGTVCATQKTARRMPHRPRGNGGAVTTPGRATRVQVRPTMPRPSSIASIPGTALRITICASRMSATIAPIRRPRTATPGPRY